MNPEDEAEEDGANIDLDSQRKGKCVVLKTSTRQVNKLARTCSGARLAHGFLFAYGSASTRVKVWATIAHGEATVGATDQTNSGTSTICALRRMQLCGQLETRCAALRQQVVRDAHGIRQFQAPR